MSAATSAARAVLTEFLPAYLKGGRVPVGRPLGVAEVAAIEALVEAGEVPGDVSQARRRQAAAIAPPRSEMALVPAEATAVAVIHNLLALGDPDLEGAGGRLLGRRRAARYTAALAATLPEPGDREAALSAHGLVWPLVAARRVDAVMRFWAGRIRYPGRPPPARATRLPRLRRVRVEEMDVPAVEPQDDADVTAALRHLLRYSPITSLLTPDRALPPFRLDGLAACMADEHLCRGIMRSWLASPDVGDVGGRLVRALLLRLHDPVDKAEVSLWLHACYHLHLAAEHEALLKGAPEPTPGGPGCVAATESARFHLALFKLLYRGGEVFGVPGPDALGEALTSRLTAYDAALKAVPTKDEERAILEALKSKIPMVGFPGWPRRPTEALAEDGEGVTDEVTV